ncbi:MAG: DTW domain-containing protein, partial [Myxococcaceae bacterium]
RRPGNYRIRKEPSAECLSTIEAVVEVLGQLEGAPEKFDPMLGAFDYMVDRQLQSQAERVGPPRYKLHRQRNPRAGFLPATIAKRPDDWVVVYGEADAHPSPRFPGSEPVHELLHLAACRLSDGARFESVLRPRTTIAESTPHHMELTASRFEYGEDRTEALARWKAFLRSTDILCGWGYFTLGLLRAEEVEWPYEDLRNYSVRFLKRRPGGIEQAAELMGKTVVPWTEGRAGRRIAALEQVLRRLAAPREGCLSV